MPVFTISIPDTQSSVSRPVVLDVIRDLIVDTGIPADTKIVYQNDVNQSIQPGSTLDDKNAGVQFTQKSRLYLEVNEEFIQDAPYDMAVHYPDARFIFKDEALDLYVRPAYSPMKVEISVRFHASDKNAAERWRNEMRARVAMKKDVRLHTANYHYAIPAEVLYVMGELHRLRENQYGYGQDFAQYFRSHCDPRITTITDQAGKSATVVVPEIQGQLQGFFDFDTAPEKGSREDNLAGWNISFTYTFLYNKPIDTVMQYPLIVHQQLIPAKICPNPNRDHPSVWERLPQVRNQSDAAMHTVDTQTRYLKAKQAQGYSIPFYDEFVPHTIPPDTMRFLTILNLVDGNSPRECFNLGQIPGFVFLPVVLDFIKNEAPYMTQPFRSVLNLVLYEDTRLLDANKLVIDPDLTIHTLVDMDPRLVYHVRFSGYTDFGNLDPAAIQRAREHGEAMLVIFSVLFPWLPLPNLINGMITQADWDNLIEAITRLRGLSNNAYYGLNRVQLLTISVIEN